jgi:biopolymer transport protein ExbD
MKQYGSRFEEQPGVDINMSPLIDIVFLLLIFFIVTTVFVEEAGIPIEKPHATSSVELEKQSLQFAVSADGRIVYGKREVTLNSVRGIVARQIQRKEVPVVILADVQSPSGVLIELHDECRNAGAPQVFVSTTNEAGR